jgi:putative DNA primase/helicase
MESTNEDSPLEHVPTDLQEHPQWVVWRYGELQANGKRKKVPYNPATGNPAKSTDSSTHTNFTRAAWALTMDGFRGLGFVLNQSDPFTCIDLDHCRDAETGVMTPQAEQIIRRFNSYTEVSPSGEGIHIWMRGALPRPNKGPGSIAEVYDHAHYLTLTGNRLAGTPTTIEDRQEELTAWYVETFGVPAESTKSGTLSSFPSDLDDERLIEKALASDVVLRDLWAGDPSAYTHPDGTMDHSRADMALCGRLAFWTGKDAARMDRLFRQSGLYVLPDRAEKWDRVHYGDGRTYGDGTIDRAIEQQATVYTPGKRTDRRISHPHPWQRTSETPLMCGYASRAVDAPFAQAQRAQPRNGVYAAGIAANCG